MELTQSPLLEEVFGPFATPNSDEMIPTGGLEARIGNDWIPVTVDVWRAWTGRRKMWGLEYHGPVYSLGAPDEADPWTGPRECGCGACQAHVVPDKNLS